MSALVLLAVAEGNLIGFLIWLIFVLLLVALAFWVMGRFFPALPEPFRTIILVVLALILLAVAAKQLGLI